MDRGRPRPANDVERYGLVHLAAEAFYFEIWIAAIEGVAKRRRGLGRPLESQHALAPGDAGEMIRDSAGFRGLLRRMPDGCAVDALSGLSPHRRDPAAARRASKLQSGLPPVRSRRPSFH
jgi:hypothetical protein